MKHLLLVSFLIVIASCKKDPDPEPTPTPPASTAPTMQGDWLWVSYHQVAYDQDGVKIAEGITPIGAGSPHTYSSDKNIYVTGSSALLGTYVEGSSSTYTSGGPITLYLSKLTADSMVLKQYPNGCNNCYSMDYYFVKP